MNIPLSFSDAQTELATLTSQTGNFTFTSAELTQALTFAWQDSYVTKAVWDSSTTFVSGTWQYAIPATVTAVQGLYFQRTSTDNPEPISPDLYEVVAGNIQFNRDAAWWLNDTYTIYVKGRYKLTTSDSLPTVNLANYTLYLAAERLLNQLLLKKTFVFLTNDTNISEIVAALRTFSTSVLTYKQGLLREYEEA